MSIKKQSFKACPAKLKRSGGFTLLEILLVVGIIALLAGIVIVAINPAKQLATVRNTERRSDIKQINDALVQYYIDNFRYPEGVDTLKEICDTEALASSSVPSGLCTNLVNLSDLVPTYLTAIPKDPQGPVTALLPVANAATNGTGYDVMKTASGNIGVVAERAELGTSIAIGVATTIGGGDNTALNISGLVAHYKMNDTDGTTVVDSVAGNNGTATEDTSAMHVSGKVGGALSFDGGSEVDYDTTSFPAGDSDSTVGAWVYPTNYDSWGIVASWGGVDPWNNTIRAFSIQPGGYMGFGAYANDYTSSVVVPLNTWSYLAWVYDGTNIYFYLNGVLDDTYNIGTIATNNSDQISGYHSMGGVNGGTAGTFVGSIDDVRIYNKALSQDEILQIYNSGAGTEAE